jgi:RNA polymerase sigma-70 factor, ECF subfamily
VRKTDGCARVHEEHSDQGGHTMFQLKDMLKLELNLYRFALSLCKNPVVAEDLVQETFARAIANSEKFQEGTNLRAWLFVILRNKYLVDLRKRKREREDRDGIHAGKLIAVENSDYAVEIEELFAAFEKLEPLHQEALIRVCVLGQEYHEAAESIGCKIGTVKSRVNRAKGLLLARLNQ